jgi:hypothetical protein
MLTFMGLLVGIPLFVTPSSSICKFFFSPLNRLFFVLVNELVSGLYWILLGFQDFGVLGLVAGYAETRVWVEFFS